MKKELDFKMQLEGYIENLQDKIKGFDMEIENFSKRIFILIFITVPKITLVFNLFFNYRQ